jgi:enamine deaminase RidA (YjgF/YER057c/UK114 family)
VINPWTWQDAYGFVQANDVSGAERTLHVSGQTSTSADGEVLHAGDMAGQAAQALENLETVLREAGMTLANVMRLNHYTTDVDRYLAEAWGLIAARLGEAGCRPASTLLGVTRLAYPDLLLEIEATAVA